MLRSLWIAVVLLVFAVVLMLAPLRFTSPVPPAVEVPDWATATTPVRQPKMRPQYEAGVFTYRCSECHAIIPPREQAYRTPLQHKEILSEHGINTHCLNCHHPSNRDAFVDDVGGEIPWDQPQLLCSKCHGPVYRDWQHGSHGRTDGFWDESQGPRLRRKCIECHDPHHPPFPALRPAPGPRTLRMGPPDHTSAHSAHNPLRLERYGDTGTDSRSLDEEQ